MNNSNQNSNTRTTSQILNYQIIQTIYEGNRTLVYRAFRTNDQQPVVIKILKNEYPTFSELVQFRNQYTIAKNLNSPLIIQTYSLEPYRNGYVLVMEDFGGISLKEWAIKEINSLSLGEFLEIAIALCNTLDILYHNRIIHKDIKPANILINPENKQVKLIDFSIASLLPRETQTLFNPNVLEGTLAYISPEQTGRMNRGIDYRTDFYSLGITFYELLTGELPFQSNDPMELVHCHIAKPAPLVHEINPKIPSVLSDILSKLMAKNAEDRYQSALGLKYDLEKCLGQLQETEKIGNFKIAERDVCDRFIIPDKLYGRETEVETLLQAFERVANPPESPLAKGGHRGVEMMLVAGFSGIGKTAVVNEVHKPIVRQRGYFIKGKFDQFQRNIPFSAFMQAFRDLMGQLLTESDAQIQQWKSKILEALGENGQVIVEVIPELSRIIGGQSPAPELSGTAAQNRFNLLFQKFTKVFTSADHPLVIFLDDLQWADSVSLKLIQLLIADTGHLLLIGAYRDNEVNPVHPLMLTLSEIEKTLFTINTITLTPLSQAKVNQLVADTLKCSEDLAWTLSQLIYQKTQGNPFFTTQFLKALHQDGLIRFDYRPLSPLSKQVGGWQFDIAQVTIQAVTDEIVAFMALQLGKLPPSTQQVLQLAACIGNQFDLETLAIVSEQSQIETATNLWKALQEGLILPIGNVYKFYVGQDGLAVNQENQETVTYKFLHDRVQQAAYSLIPDDQKQITHLQIGQLLLQNTSPSTREDKLFDIVNHLNVGKSLIAERSQLTELAQLNLAAGCKAKLSTAYGAAIAYCTTGMELLEPDCWHSQYELTLNLYVAATEVAYLNGDFEGMEHLAASVLQQARTILDKIKIYEIQIFAQTAQMQMLKAIAIGREALSQLGVELPSEPDPTKINEALQNLTSQLQGRQIATLIDLPVMRNPTSLAAIQLLGTLFATIFQGMPSLLPLVAGKMVSLSLQFGNAPASTMGYTMQGMVLCTFFGQVETGYDFGNLALSLLNRFNSREFKCLTLFWFGTAIQYRRESLHSAAMTLKEGYLAGIETGDFLNGGYSACMYIDTCFFMGAELDALDVETASYSSMMVQVKQYSVQLYLDMKHQAIENLRNTVSQPDVLSGIAYNETIMLPKHRQGNQFTVLASVYIYKLVMASLWGNYAAAFDYVVQAKLYVMSVSGMVLEPVFHFYAALTYLGVFPTQPEIEQAEILSAAETHQTTLHKWAQDAPMNHLHQWYLIDAEKHRVLDDKIAAIECYDRAIALAKDNQFTNDEALANELAAKFYLNWGKEKFAAGYMQEAYYCYARWGAKAKVNHLEKTYPQLLQPILQQQKLNLNPRETIGFQGTSSSTYTHSTGNTSISDVLDFTSVLKAAQAISSSLELDSLIASLTRIILENSGAKKVALILPQEQTWQVKAITFIHQEIDIQTLLEPQSIDSCPDIPLKIIHYVKNTKQTVIVDKLLTDIPGLIGQYMLEHQPQSVCCTPIINQRHLVGILYLENRVTSGVFTEERLQVINLLASQAAISLENARLYQQAKLALVDLQQAQLQIVQSEKMSALGNLVAGVAHEMNNPLGFISASLEEAKPTFTELIEHLRLYQETFPNSSDEIKDHASEIDLNYTLEDLPKIINSMGMACDRLRNISTSLRTFSRADKDYKVPFYLHEGIDSTILILKHRLKANEQRPAIEVITNYDNLPQIDCFPGQLNQVFMNILANAIDALEESNIGRNFAEIKANSNCIKIQTSVENEGVKIAIADNGKGMTAEVKEKIFDHLFTTKTVGKGTGLGLTIARQIVEEKHGGSIRVNSILGTGTEFIITLPI